MRLLIARAPEGRSRKAQVNEPVAGRGSGDQGTVYPELTQPRMAIKLYTKPESAAAAEEKIWAMLVRPPEHDVEGHGSREYIQIAWPKEAIYEPGGRFVGFSMRLVPEGETTSLANLTGGIADRRRARLPEDYRYRLYVARNLAAVFRYIHAKRHWIIDTKPENVLVYRRGGFTCLIDCDSFSIDSGKRRFPAAASSAAYVGWEIPRPVDPHRLDETQDRFGLAVLLFRLLNSGWHPCSGSDPNHRLPSEEERKLAARAFFIGSNPRLSAPPRSIHHFLGGPPADVGGEIEDSTPYCRIGIVSKVASLGSEKLVQSMLL